jgi:hypothetical protein
MLLFEFVIPSKKKKERSHWNFLMMIYDKMIFQINFFSF